MKTETEQTESELFKILVLKITTNGIDTKQTNKTPDVKKMFSSHILQIDIGFTVTTVSLDYKSTFKKTCLPVLSDAIMV